jgi:dTDP-4-dehydrorhamnose reductase
LLHWFLSQPLHSKLNGYSNAFWTGLTTLELAKVIHEIIKQNISGLIQVVPNDKINKYDLLKLFNSIFRNDQLEIVDYDTYNVDKSLVSKRQDFNYHVPTYKQMLEDLKVWILDQNIVYKHYQL